MDLSKLMLMTGVSILFSTQSVFADGLLTIKDNNTNYVQCMKGIKGVDLKLCSANSENYCNAEIVNNYFMASAIKLNCIKKYSGPELIYRFSS